MSEFVLPLSFPNDCVKCFILLLYFPWLSVNLGFDHQISQMDLEIVGPDSGSTRKVFHPVAKFLFARSNDEEQHVVNGCAPSCIGIDNISVQTVDSLK